jgi:molybdate transport repressor ModE-like protein
MRLTPALVWTLEDGGAEPLPLDRRLLPLLETIAETGSLAAAVAARGLSYRAAWGLLRDYKQKFGVPIVELSRGRGARLAPAGQALLTAQRTAAQRIGRILPALALDLGGRSEERQPLLRLSMAASHDLALASLRDTLPASAGLAVEISFMGSLHALRQLDAGQVDVAGFHVPLDAHPGDASTPFRRYLRARRDRLVGLFEREQGLMLRPGNPARVRSFRDIARKGLRFVNRQRGSGTRLLIDRLIAAAGLEPATLAGYTTEEFTHPAVAAMVASGAADAGFGLRAAAVEQRLAFVPLVRERYYLAVRASALTTPAVRRLLGELRGERFARIVDRLPGYRRMAASAPFGLDALDIQRDHAAGALR